MRTHVLCLLLLACITICSGNFCSAFSPVNKVRRYDNYRVFRITPQTEEELKFIIDTIKKWQTLDVWKHPSQVGKAVDIMVPPSEQFIFVKSFTLPGLTIETWIPDVQALIDEGETERVKRSAMNPDSTFNYNTYHTYEEIAAWMDDFAASNSGISKVAVSSTIEGETIYGLQIVKNAAATNVAYIQGGIHAREWVSPATMIYLAKMFIDNYGTDSIVTGMLDNFQWIIVPVFNVDGYKHSHTTDRMWRKNRNPNDGHRQCLGVDLNRNYPYAWGGAGRSKCAEDYQGTGPLSEPETSGSNAFLQTFGSNLKLYIDFHSYGQYWLYPWGYTRKTVEHPDRQAQHDAAVEVENAITACHGMDYFVGESGADLYPATGGSEDFGYGTLGVKYTYVVELRDEKTYGFELPPDQIQPTAEEIFAGMKTLGARLNAEYGAA